MPHGGTEGVLQLGKPFVDRGKICKNIEILFARLQPFRRDGVGHSGLSSVQEERASLDGFEQSGKMLLFGGQIAHGRREARARAIV